LEVWGSIRLLLSRQGNILQPAPTGAW
jgi:hypothetical protein